MDNIVHFRDVNRKKTFHRCNERKCLTYDNDMHTRFPKTMSKSNGILKLSYPSKPLTKTKNPVLTLSVVSSLRKPFSSYFYFNLVRGTLLSNCDNDCLRY